MGRCSRQTLHVYPGFVRAYAEDPLHWFVLRQSRPAWVVMAELGGVLEGDCYDTEIIVEPGAALVLSAQSATKILRMPSGSAQHRRRIVVKEDARLIWWPSALIPFEDSDYCQQTWCELGPRSQVVLGEQIMGGRSAYGEHLKFRQLHLSVHVARAGELWPLYRENQRFLPAQEQLRHEGSWGAYSAMATIAQFGLNATGPRARAVGAPGAMAAPDALMGVMSVEGGSVTRMAAFTIAAIRRRCQELMGPWMQEMGMGSSILPPEWMG